MSMVSHIIKDALTTSNEAVSYQYNARLFEDLADAIAGVRTAQTPDKYDNKNSQLAKIGDVIRKHTNLLVHASIYESSEMNAWVMVPDINRNNTIYGMGYADHPYFTEKDARAKLADKKLIEAEVDLEKGRVKGFYSELSVPITITKGLLNTMKGREGEYLISNEEIAAIILHEVGHCMTFLEAMTRAMRKNWILESRLKDFRRASRSEKIKIINQLKKDELLPRDTEENVLVEVKNDDDALQMILGSFAKKVYSDPDTIMHDQTAFESASDQFAVRMGAGAYLASALTKMHNQYSGFIRFDYWMTMFADIARWAFIVVGVALGIATAQLYILFLAGVMFFMSILHGLADGIFPYDKNGDRITRILQEQITAFKKNNLPADMKKQLLESYESMKKSYDEIVKTNDSINSRILNLIIPFFRRNKKSKEYQQLIESLQNNELYVSAHRF